VVKALVEHKFSPVSVRMTRVKMKTASGSNPEVELPSLAPLPRADANRSGSLGCPTRGQGARRSGPGLDFRTPGADILKSAVIPELNGQFPATVAPTGPAALPERAS